MIIINNKINIIKYQKYKEKIFYFRTNLINDISLGIFCKYYLFSFIKYLFLLG